MRVEITGLQIASPDERSVIVHGRPLRVQLELVNHFPHVLEVEAVVDFADIWGVSRLIRSAPLTVPLGRSWHELRLPPDSLPLGRYSLSVAVVGHDLYRSRRLVDVLQVPPGLPPHLAEPWGQWSQREGELPRDALVWRVEQVRIQVDGREPAVIPPGADVEVIMRVDLNGLPPDPMVRLQIFSLCGDMVLGTNTIRWGIAFEERGRSELRASFCPLNLAPGNYLITVGLWEDEWASSAHQARHGYFEIHMGDASRGRLANRLELLEAESVGLTTETTEDKKQEPTEGIEEEAGSDAEHVTLLGDGQVTRGQWLRLRLMEDGPAEGRAWVERREREVATASTGALVCEGGAVWMWKLRALLPPGEYTLCYARWRSGEAAGEPIRFPLLVIDEQE